MGIDEIELDRRRFVLCISNLGEPNVLEDALKIVGKYFHDPKSFIGDLGMREVADFYFALRDADMNNQAYGWAGLVEIVSPNITFGRIQLDQLYVEHLLQN